MFDKVIDIIVDSTSGCTGCTYGEVSKGEVITVVCFTDDRVICLNNAD